jgi:hypothetical protein
VNNPIAKTSNNVNHMGNFTQTCIPSIALVKAENMQIDARRLRRPRKSPISAFSSGPDWVVSCANKESILGCKLM